MARESLDIWATTPAGTTVRLSSADAGRLSDADGSGCLTVLDLDRYGFWAQPALGWLLPARHPVFAGAPGPPDPELSAAYTAVRRASVWLAGRTAVESAAQELVRANEILGFAEDRTAIRTLADPRWTPRRLAGLYGWFGADGASLLDRTLSRLFDAAGLSAHPDSMPNIREIASRARESRDPAWEVLERRYARWSLAPAAAHAVRLLGRSTVDHSGSRIHRALLVDAGSVGIASGDVIEALLAASTVDQVDAAPLTVASVATGETTSQLVAYARVFLDGQPAAFVLGAATTVMAVAT